MKNDLKSIEAIKAYARKVLCGQNPTNTLLIRMFDEIIDNAPGLWIPTSEMLPEEYDSYLVMWRRRDGEHPDGLFYEICEYSPEEDEWERIEQAGEAGAEIVAWMPLPERYEPKEKENG